MKQKWMTVLLLIFLLLDLSQSTATAYQSTSTVTAGSASVASGGSVTISVTANIPMDTLVGAIKIYLDYDSAVVSATGCSIISGSGACGYGTPGQVIFNTTAISGLQGSLTLAQITFEAVGSGGNSTALSLTVDTFTDTDGNPLNAIAQNGQITITGSTVPSRTPTRTQGPSRTPTETRTETPTRTTGPSRTPTETRTIGPSRTPTETRTPGPSKTTGPSKTPVDTNTPGGPTDTKGPGAKTATFTPPPTLTGGPTLTKGPTAVPPTVSFYADDIYLQYGECTNLYWRVLGAAYVYLSGGQVNTQGSTQVCPAETTVYTLYVITQYGDYYYTVTIQVTTPTQVQPTEKEGQSGGGAPTATKKPKKVKPTNTVEPTDHLLSFAEMASAEFSTILTSEPASTLLDEVKAGMSVANCKDTPCIARVVADRVVTNNQNVGQIIGVIDGLWNKQGVEAFGPRWPWAYEMVLEFARLGVNINMGGVLSPVNLLAINQTRLRVGRLNDNQVYKEIPYSAFDIEEESKFIFYPADQETTLYLQGYGDGKATIFLVNTASPWGEIVLYLDVPVSSTMAAQVDLVDSKWLLKIDSNGDGVVDEQRPPTSIKPIRPGEAQPEATVTPTATSGKQPNQICGGIFGLVLVPVGGMLWQLKRRKRLI